MRSEAALPRRPATRVAGGIGALRIPRPRVRIGPAGVLFATAFALYLAIAIVLVYVLHSAMTDAVARVANASYALYSRDPHLSSIGFVWPPLPTLVLIPLLPLKAIIPGLVSQAFAANIASAAFMAGAVAVLYSTLRERAVSWRASLALTAAFALHPLIAYYGANGMTEAAAIFFLLLAARSLARWADGGHSRHLVPAGIALACAYLTRYETLGAGAVATVVVFGLSLRRGAGPERGKRALADAVILGAPVAFAVVGWAVVGWFIVGEPFGYLTSAYGISTNVALGRGGASPLGGGHILSQILAMQPFVLPLVAAAAAVAIRRRSAASLVMFAVVGSGFAMPVLLFLAGRTYGFLRHMIMAVPLAVLLAGSLVSRVSAPRRRLARGALAVAAVLSVAAAIPAAATGLRDRDVAPQEEVARVVTTPGLDVRDMRARLDPYVVSREVAAFLDAKRLPEGSVLVDVASVFDIVLASRYPKRFVITPDRDFQAALQAPALYGIRYMVTVQNDGIGKADALNRAYPTLHANGAGLGRLVEEFQASFYRFRIYEITDARLRRVPAESAQ